MKLNMLKKLVLGAALAASVATTSFAADDLFGPITPNKSVANYVVKLLDTYSQLNSYVGKDGLYFVREAGKGQNSDPNVHSGWALYLYDGRASRFRLVSKQEAMGSGQGGGDYLTVALYQADINPYKYQIREADARSQTNATEIASLKNADTIIVSSINELIATTGTLTETVNGITAAVAECNTKIDAADAAASNATTVAESAAATLASITPKVGTLSERVETLDQKIDTTASAASGYTDTKVADLKVDIITNTATRMRATLTTATNFTNQVKVEALASASSDASSKDAALAETLRGEIDAAKGEAVASANLYTDGKTSGLLTAADAADIYQPKGSYQPAGNYLVPADIEGKADKSFLFKDNLFYNELVYGSIKSIFWNETTGGGIRLENSDTGVKTAFSVNDGGGGGIYGQIYAVKKIDDKSTGTRITITDNGAFYTVTNTYQWTAKDEIVAKRDLDALQPKGDYVVAGEALELPLKVKKGNKVYVLDVVDEGEGDISLSVNEAPVE